MLTIKLGKSSGADGVTSRPNPTFSWPGIRLKNMRAYLRLEGYKLSGRSSPHPCRPCSLEHRSFLLVQHPCLCAVNIHQFPLRITSTKKPVADHPWSKTSSPEILLDLTQSDKNKKALRYVTIVSISGSSMASCATAAVRSIVRRTFGGPVI